MILNTLYSQRTNVFFLNQAIKISNIITLGIISSIATIFIFITPNRIAEYWVIIDNTINCFAVYMAFAFGNRLYNNVFICQNACFPFMKNCCIVCCIPKQIPPGVSFEILQPMDQRRATELDNIPIMNSEITLSDNLDMKRDIRKEIQHSIKSIGLT